MANLEVIQAHALMRELDAWTWISCQTGPLICNLVFSRDVLEPYKRVNCISMAAELLNISNTRSLKADKLALKLELLTVVRDEECCFVVKVCLVLDHWLAQE